QLADAVVVLEGIVRAKELAAPDAVDLLLFFDADDQTFKVAALTDIVSAGGGGGGGGGAPTTVDYLVRTASGSLSAERVVTDTASITWDWATAGQAKAQRAALTGDVTAAADSNATTIANGVVSTAKLGVDITVAGKSLLTGADATAQRATLGLAA